MYCSRNYPLTNSDKTPLRDLAGEMEDPPDEIGDPHYDDPSLAVLFAQLKSKSLQTVKGTIQISGQTEFNFVNQMARVLCRMGCHVLAIDLVRSWSFERPVVAAPAQSKDMADTLDERLLEVVEEDQRSRSRPSPERSLSSTRPPPSPTLRKTFARLRRTSMIIDMELPSFPPTRVPSPPPRVGIANGALAANGTSTMDTPRGRPGANLASDTSTLNPPTDKGFGNLMKSAKKDVVVPEFDMSSFGF
ncbi:regulator of (H+)-ATPase in vacuolar membrane [Tulasnella sp. 427]|nr:regulator of (H+)-ATPase in vacuolar membrane [Tulasnella sp. 427]